MRLGAGLEPASLRCSWEVSRAVWAGLLSIPLSGGRGAPIRGWGGRASQMEGYLFPSPAPVQHLETSQGISVLSHVVS